MYKNVFSIPVYTKPEVIIDQIINIHVFNSNSAIVLHLNPVFSWESEYIDSEESFMKTIEGFEYVYVNPERVRCGYYDIIGAHMSNFKFISKILDFEYFTFTASNELYCRRGMDKLLIGEDALVGHRKIDTEKSSWVHSKVKEKDVYYKALFPNMADKKYIYCGFCEGTSYKKEIFAHIVAMIESIYDHSNVQLLYAREEVYFPQALRIISNEDNIIYKRTTYMPWKKDLLISCTDVCDIVDNVKDYYAVKRVNLDLLYSTRAFIRQYIGKYHEKLEQVLGKKIKTYSVEELSHLDCDVDESQKLAFRANIVNEVQNPTWYYL